MLLRRPFTTWLPLIGVALFAACEPSGEPAESPAVDTLPAADPGADRAAVEAAVAAHWAAINAGDTLAVMSHHTPDITLFVADAEPRFALPSPEAEPILERWRGAQPNWVVEDLEVQLMDGVAVATFYLGGSTTWADGSVDERRRRVTEVWVRQADGSWKEAHHHDSVFTGSG